MKRIVGLISIISLVYSVSARSQSDFCNRQELSQYISTIQAHENQVPAMNPRFVQCSDPQLKEQYLFWNAFYNAYSQPATRATETLQAAQLFPQTADTSEIARTIRDARIGQPEKLMARIDEGQLDYTENKRNLLTLGRSLARTGKFRSAQTFYDEYLKHQPEDEIVDAEYLYVMIWSGELASSRVRLARLKNYELSPYLTSVIGRAEKTINELATKSDKDSAQMVHLKGAFSSSFEAFSQEDESERRSLRFSYQNQFYGTVGVHELDSSLDTSAERASEFMFGSLFRFGQAATLQTEVGYFSPGTDHITGVLAATFGADNWLVSTGVRRVPLSLIRVVPRSGQGLMKNEVFGQVQLNPYLQINASLAQDGHLAPYEKYRMTAKLPAFNKLQDLGILILKLPIQYEGHPKPSPYYSTTPRTISLGVGLEYQRVITDAYEFKGEAEYLLTNRNSRLNRDSYQRLSNYQIKADLLYDLRKDIKLSFGLDFRERERDQFERTDERHLSILIGLQYTARP